MNTEAANPALPMQSTRASPLVGETKVPGDKSISHRALILSSQILGTTTVRGLLEGEDVINTSKALKAMGVAIERREDGAWVIKGVGAGGLAEPDEVLDMGNSGTGVRLLMGLVTPYPFVTFFTGDHSLVKRPMKRAAAPLEQMGAKMLSRSGMRLPLAVQGVERAMPITYRLPVASAQVKSCIMLAALNTPGITTVIEPEPTRDHTERMLRYFGFKVEQKKLDDGAMAISLAGQQNIPPQNREIFVPGDPSSAAFLVVAALIIPGSELTIRNVCLNPTRIGLFTTLLEMGGNIQFENRREVAGEEVADLVVRSSKLTGVTVPAERAPIMIDEYPILAVAAACAKGTTLMQGLAELRVKESDRLQAISDGLTACGVNNIMLEDNLSIDGADGRPQGGGTVTTHYDHRIAMAFLIMGMASGKPVRIDDARAIGTSFPNFTSKMNRLGAHITPADDHHATKFRPMIIAIDGPAASGKGTLARRISAYCNYPYLDTGSLYRMVGLKLDNEGKDPSDKEAAILAAYNIDERDFANPDLRQEKIGHAASIVSAYPEVREALLEFQRNFAANGQGAVLDGRDIGTVVCPNADLKFFVTAGLEARAKRRHRELQGEGIEVVYESVLKELKERDERDSKRKVAALVPAEDAIHIDTSNLSAREAFEKLLRHIEEKNAEEQA